MSSNSLFLIVNPNIVLTKIFYHIFKLCIPYLNPINILDSINVLDSLNNMIVKEKVILQQCPQCLGKRIMKKNIRVETPKKKIMTGTK